MCENYKIKNFLELSVEEHKKILSWRNSEEISKWMINKTVSFEEHMSFLKKLSNSNKYYFKVEDIGVIYFTVFDNYVELGLYKNPNKTKVGAKLIKLAIDYAFNKFKKSKIILYVYEHNIKAINLYKKFNFIQTQKKGNLIKMELVNAYWNN